MRFDEDKSVEYNYKVGFLEGVRAAANVMNLQPSVQAFYRVLSRMVVEQMATLKEMDE